jgi:hypothetical protein
MSYGMDAPYASGSASAPRGAGDAGLVLDTGVTAASVQLFTGGGQILYWNAFETTGTAAATVTFWDGTSTGGQYLGTVHLATGTTDTETFNELGLPVERGLYVQVVSGSVRVAVNAVLIPPGSAP